MRQPFGGLRRKWPNRILTPKEARSKYPALSSLVFLTFPELDERGQARVVSLASDTCQSCKENSGDCQCWNDE